MKIHYLQHVPFEDVAYIGEWAKENMLTINRTALFDNESFPLLTDIDCLIIMGGPMSIYDEDVYPWLKPEKAFVGRAIEADKIVIGICLGAQLIADVLGSRVYKNPVKEIGWLPVAKKRNRTGTKIASLLPDTFNAFHWHGDTFDIPEGAVHLAESEACKHQAFVYDERVLALQFHLESTRESIELLIDNCGDELAGEELAGEEQFIQGAHRIRENYGLIQELNSCMKLIMDHIYQEFIRRVD